MSFEYNGVVYRDLEPQVRYDAEQVQLLKQADVTINENLQTINTEVSGKLAKPTNPSAESAVTMLADGTVGTKPLSEIGGGGKLYRHYVGLVAQQWSSSTNEPINYAIGFTVTDTTATAHNRAYWISYFNKLANYGLCTLPEPYIFLNGSTSVDLSSIFGDISTLSDEPYIYSTSDGFTTKRDYGSKGYLINNGTDTSSTYAEYVVEL